MTVATSAGPRAWIDGGARGNPGEAGFGALIELQPGTTDWVEIAGYLGRSTNNVAEYVGLLAALTWAAEQGLRNLHRQGLAKIAADTGRCREIAAVVPLSERQIAELHIVTGVITQTRCIQGQIHELVETDPAIMVTQHPIQVPCKLAR